MTPYYLAFPEGFTGTPFYLDVVINVIFGIDIISNFFTAYYDDDYQIIDDPKV
jgi:hypothetical protein